MRFAGLILLATARLSAADAPPLPERFDADAVNHYLAARVRAGGFVGLSVAAARDGKLIYNHAFGKAALGGPGATPDTAFAVGSVTKQFACACILLLAEDGKLSARDPVAKYYPGLTSADSITLLDLMNHVSGYPDYYPLDFLDRRITKAIDPDELLKQYAGGRLDFPPGSRYSYSNTGYILLGRVVEKVSGEPFASFLDRRILKPLGMTHSAVGPVSGEKVALGHAPFILGPPELIPAEAVGWLGAAGGLYCTASDLVKWDLALVGGRVLNPESLKLMTAPRPLTGGKVQEYGCGLTLGRRDGDGVWSHGGAVSGFLAQNTMIPRTRSAVVVLSNSEQVDAAGLSRELVNLLFTDQDKAEVAVPKIDGPPAKEAAADLFRRMQNHAIDRAKLGDEFNIFLTETRVDEMAPRLKALGDPTAVEVTRVSERGGMEVASVRLSFKDGVRLRASLYRSRDGKVQQFLPAKE